MRALSIGAVALVLVACGGDRSEDVRAPREVPSLAFTHWTDRTELFVELPALRVGRESPCAVHVTVLDGFRAPAEGEVAVVLSGGGADERFVATAPSVPGIFRPVAIPRTAGTRRLRFEITTGDVRAVHDLGDVRVYASDDEAIADAPDEDEPAGRIVFLKEQQWVLEMATDVASDGAIAPSISAPAVIRAREGGEAWIVAPRSGRLAATGDELPRLGASVEANALLARMTPELEGSDRASLELAGTASRLDLDRARRERERLAGLVAAGAIPERRLVDAQHEEAAATAALRASEARLGQYQRVQRAGGAGGGLELRAPIAGRIAEVRVAPGAFVEAGARLFRIVDASSPWLEIHVAGIDASRLDDARGGWALIDGSERALVLAPEHFVARAPALDVDTQTLRVVYELTAATTALPGTLATAHLRVGEPISGLVLPRSAIVDEGAASVVYVQVEGEAFERRVVRVVAREAERVSVTGDLEAGEHVVTRGAYAVRLTASSGSVPAHDHAH